MPSQRDFGIRLGWGVNAVRGFAADCAVVVIVDVLCFSTTVEVAVSRGATVLPHRMGDDSAAGRYSPILPRIFKPPSGFLKKPATSGANSLRSSVEMDC